VVLLDHRIAPSFAETHRSVDGSLQMKIRSPTRIGEAFDFPGSGVFQRTFSVADHFTGGLASG
jgi:hypothetical protein